MTTKNVVRKLNSNEKRFVRTTNKLVGVDDETRTVSFTLSTESSDRVADVVKANGWHLDAFKKNPVVLWAHDHSMPPIGRMVSLEIKGKKLIGDVQFAKAEEFEFADTIYKLVKGGYLNAGSVGFIPLKHEYDEGRHGYDIIEAELIEFSIVPVPMNSEALRRAASEIDFTPLKSIMKSGPGNGADAIRELISEQSAPGFDPDGKLAKRASVSAAKMRFV